MRQTSTIRNLRWCEQTNSGGNLHAHVVEEAEPARGVLQEHVDPLLEAPPPPPQPALVPQVLRLEVLENTLDPYVILAACKYK